jgi:hypothetical protein
MDVTNNIILITNTLILSFKSPKKTNGKMASINTKAGYLHKIDLCLFSQTTDFPLLLDEQAADTLPV